MKESKEGRVSSLPERKEEGGRTASPKRKASPVRRPPPVPRPTSPPPHPTSPRLQAAPSISNLEQNQNDATSATEETVKAKVEDGKNNLPDVKPTTKPAAPILEAREAGAEMIKEEPVKVAGKCNKKKDLTIHLTIEEQVQCSAVQCTAV
jgi:hypothetical protein